MESALIISNTTPLINFAEIGRRDVLEALFGAITIPPAVGTLAGGGAAVGRKGRR
jgi:predicted nucleic acid-binding protein